MITQTGQYALRAMAYLAGQPEKQYVLAKTMGEELDVPPIYLKTVLQVLARKGLLDSQRGRNGGFCLSRPASEITLFQILSAVEAVERYETCILGHKVCSDHSACPIHHEWKNSRNKVLEMFIRTPLCDLMAHVRKPARRKAN